MLRLNVKSSEWYDENLEQFVYTKPCVVTLEHSLLSVSKWESKWKIPFLSEREMKKMSGKQLLDYFTAMEVEPPSEPLWFMGLTPEQSEEIVKYINEEQTATTFYSFRKDKAISNKTITSELIYYWMASLQIPFSCETWHLSRLLTLIHIASVKGQTGKKMPKREVLRSYAEINEARKKKYNTRG